MTVNPTVSATFSEAMNASTISTSTFTLTGPSGAVSGTVSYTGNTAIFSPTAALANSATYTATITTGAQDAAGNALAANYSWSFTTIAVGVVDTSNPTTVGGSVSGLQGSLVLRNNGGNDLALSSNGAFIFSTAFAAGTAYNVTVATQPVSQSCTVLNGAGTLAANVTNVSVSCVLAAPAAPTVTLGFGIKQLQFAWSAISGTTYYRVFENPDGVSGYSQVGADLTATSYNHGIVLYRRVNASYFVQACNSAGCTASPAVYVSVGLTQSIGYFKASNTNAGDWFGTAVALSIDGNTLAVAAYREDSNAELINGNQADNSASFAGAVYVYTRSAGVWLQQAYVKGSGTSVSFFGYAVALSSDGNTLAVGAPAAGSSGQVNVYTRSAGVWSSSGYAQASNANLTDWFETAVALSSDGNTLAVGAPFEDSNATGINGNQADNSATDAGAVYVYTRSAGVWPQQAYVKASNTNAGDDFGRAVALSGDGNTLAVGAPFEDSNATGINGNQADNSVSEAGAVYVYTRSAGIWSQQAYVKASDTNAYTVLGDMFGFAVALSGDGNTLAVGAHREDSNATGINGNHLDNSASDAGAVYVYTRSAGAWSQQAYVKASITSPTGGEFGFAVALSSDGNALAVGAHRESSNATGINGNQLWSSLAIHAGAVYVYTRSAGVWSQQAYVKASNTNASDLFGTAVALSGDGNTLAVGAVDEDSNATGINGNQADNSASGAGAVYLY
ncbi:MAG: Ig-like domain-containing protein [Gammaproteobacteria bacterium]